MAVRYIPYFPNTLEGQAILDNFVRTKRVLRYRDNDQVIDRIQRGMPLYEMELKEQIGKNPRYFMPGAYIQFVRFKGNTNGGEILNERRFEGCLYKILPLLGNFIRDGIMTKRSVPISILREKDVQNYPYKVLRELMMNAVMHRDYQANMPTRLYQYDHHIEIMNPGGLYGQARPENFPHVNDYRNSVLAEMMKNLNYVNMFNHGVSEVQGLLKENQSPAAEFNVNLVTAFSVVVREPDAAETMQKDPDTMQKTMHKTMQKDAKSIQKAIQKALDERGISITDLQMDILVYFYLYPKATRNDYISSDENISEGGTKSNISRLQKLELLKRKGGKKNGEWIIAIDLSNDDDI